MRHNLILSNSSDNRVTFGFDELSMSLPKKLAFVDIETTGCSLYRDRVIEIGVLRVEDGQIVETMDTLLNPQRALPPEIEILTGIHAIDLEGAPTFYQIKQDLKNLLEDCVFVAHNVRFDYSFLKNEFKRFDIEFSPKQICTVKLSRSLFPQYRHHNLDAIIERFNFSYTDRHRAFSDAKILFDFFQTIQTSLSEELVLAAVNKCLKRPSIPLHISNEELDSLPQKPGVYIFYGENDLPLYIGKSINIRNRVLNHFSSDHISSNELKITQQVKRIETIETAGELGALLRESALIKTMQPLLNRKLRNSRNLLFGKSVKNKDGYLEVELVEAPEISVDELDQVVGIFKSIKTAKEYFIHLAKEHELCEKLLGVERTKGNCFGYRLGRCKGACSTKEPAIKYNLRFLEAFVKTKIKPWVFDGPIVIKDGEGDEAQGFVVDKWIVLGTIDNKTGQLERFNEDEIRFDVDTYKILSSYLRSEKSSENVLTSTFKLKQPELFDQPADFISA